MENRIEIGVVINRDLETVWKCLTEPEHIMGWAFASDDWHCPKAESVLVVGGEFCNRMEAKDGSFGFDFAGVYTQVIPPTTLEYRLGDDRFVRTDLSVFGDMTKVQQFFDPEKDNSVEMQRAGWQSILDNFKRYCESI